MTEDLKPLFKLASRGSEVQTWRCQIDGARYRTIHGALNGSQVTSDWTTCKGKNLGRSNATTAEEQAWAEVKARYKKMVEQSGYNDTLEHAGRHSYFVPMLARIFDRGKSVKPEQWVRTARVFAQPKLDGYRALFRSDGAWSRKGKRIMTMGHVEDALRPVFASWPDLVIDGEGYNHDLKADFPRLMSIARKTNPKAEEIYEATRNLQFHVFDCAGSHGHLSFRARWEFIQTTLLPLVAIGEPVRLVDTREVKDYVHLDEIYAEHMELGYEGQIIRISCPEGGYEQGPNRSAFLHKRKEFLDKEFRIKRLFEGKGNKSKMCGGVEYWLDAKKDKTFRSGIRGNRAYLREIWSRRDEFIGGEGTVRFQEFSPYGIPRFPVTVYLWDDEGRDV